MVLLPRTRVPGRIVGTFQGGFAMSTDENKTIVHGLTEA